MSSGTQNHTKSRNRLNCFKLNSQHLKTEFMKKAFPLVSPGFVYADGSPEPPVVVSEGMSLRDYFAAQALIGIIPIYQGRYLMHITEAVAAAYEYADEMVRQSEQKK